MKKFASPRKLALGYARRDWAVPPLHTVKNGICSCAQGASCKRPGKHPRTINGVKDSTTDRGEIKTWWKKWPNANIGVATGSISGFFALDVDGKAGRASLEALQAKHERLPTTMTVKTGGGSHLYFRCDRVQVSNSVSSLGDGLDVRGDGGYVVGAGVAQQIGLDASEIQATIASGLKAGRQCPRALPFSAAHAQIQTVDPPEKHGDEHAGQLARLGETDTDNAQRFAERFGPTAIHTPGMGWLVFDGKRWCPDSLHGVLELAKETARMIAQEAEHLSDDAARARRKVFSLQSLSKGALDRMLDLAKSLLAVEDARLDADPWLLNVENGTIDLRTGHLEKHALQRLKIERCLVIGKAISCPDRRTVILRPWSNAIRVT